MLAGLCTPQEAIRPSVYPNLDMLFSGEIPPNPSELLGNQRMQNMIQQLSQVYDYILMDTPPVGIVADACVAASYLDGVLFLVRQGRTEKEAVARGLRQLDIAGARLMGFVLNGSDEERGRKYRYKYHYKYKYKYGYAYAYEAADRKQKKKAAGEKKK